MNEQQDNLTFELDGTRPIASSEIEVVETYEVDGIRPIAESPDFLVRENRNSDTEKRPVSFGGLDADLVIEVDGKRPVDHSEIEVVDTFEADGERPIMSNK